MLMQVTNIYCFCLLIVLILKGFYKKIGTFQEVTVNNFCL